jgi:N12 class adenine-specific DNA methylase
MDAGIKMVNNLEPSVGSGNFIGMHPQANWTAVDIDKTNTEIVARLYPNAKVFNESYETFRGKGYDLIISNVPFASFSSLAREYAGTIKPMFKAIHNFFFAQSIDKLKTGGVMAFMTSTGTMDGTGEGQRLRQHLVSQMDVIGAFRLPMGTQKANASTDVMIDVIFLQKRPEGVESKQADKNQSFVNIASKDGHKINQYFIDYPESVLGELSIGKNKTSMGKVGWIVTGEADYSKMKIEPQDYTATKKAEQDSFTDPDAAQQYADKNGLKFIDGTTKPFFKDGIIYDKAVSYSEFSGGGLFGRKATGVSADKMAALQKIDETHDAELVHDYEHKYSKPPHTDKLLELWAKNVHAVQQLKSYLSLFDKHFSLSDIFTKQVRFENSGKIEVDEHSPLYDRAESLENADGIFSPKTDLLSADEIQGLLDSNDYAKLPNGDLQNSRLYYAGNIYEKLDIAAKVKPAAQRDKQIERLTRAKPALIPIKDITLTGKETWLPDSAITAIGKKTYHDGTVIIGDRAIEDNHLLHLFNQYLNNDKLVAKGRDDTPEEYADRLKVAQDTLHNEVLPLIKQRLLDDGLADEIVDAYNRTKNFFAEPIFDGSSLKNLPETFRGKPFKLMQHQLEGAERAIYNKKGVLAFSPGLGKTPTAIVVADQLLQKGVMKKPLFIVPANTIPQWEATTRDLYPNAKVYEFPKYTSGINKGKPKDWPSMSAADKEKMAYDLTNNQYDYTFISTNLAQKFTIPPKRLGEYVDKLTESIISMEKDDEDLNKSQIKAKATRIAKIRMLKATIMASYADSNANGFDMGKMGFDALFADEVQYYKNIGMQSEDAKGGIGANVAINAKYPLIEKNGKMVADMTQSPLSVSLGSSRSYDFRFKTQFISENNNGNNIFLLTGTPTPNKPLELLTLLFHLDTKILDEYHIDNVGQFVDEFLDIQAVEETAVDGAAKLKDQLVAIKNIFGLKKIISRYIDYRSPESASDLTRPKQNNITHVILQSDESQEIFEDVQARILQAVEDSKTKRSGGIVEEEKMITMYGAGRDASVDVRLYTPSKLGKGNIAEGTVFQKETRSQYSKIAKTVELVAAKNKLDPEAGQLIFLDRLKFSSGNGSTHEDIRNDILEATGLKPNQVVFVNGGEYVNPNTGKIAKNIKPEMLQTIMDDYNAGKIKVLIGNTTKLGVGVDLQTTTTDIYQLDKPYRPDEIEQRNNRGVRQGNRNAVVNVHTFNQPGTFDAMSDRIIESKQGFNDVFWKTQASDKANVKGEEAPGHFDAAIELERDPLKKRKLEIQRDLNQASAKKSQLEKQVSALAKRIRSATEAKTQYKNANQGIDTRAAPKYEDQTEAERKKSITSWQKRQAEQRALNVGRIADISTDLTELEDNKTQRSLELEAHNAHVANIRDKYVVNGVVSLDAIKNGGNQDAALFSKASILSDNAKPAGITESQADALIAQFISDFDGIDGVTFEHYETLADAVGEREAKKLGRVKGYYLPRENKIIIIRDSLGDVQDTITTLRHETLGHFGLNLLTPADKLAFLASISRDKNTNALRPFFDDVVRDYPEMGQDEFMQAEEVFAKVAEEQPTALTEWLDRQLLKLSRLLRNVGFLKGHVTKAEMRKMVKSLAEGIRRGDTQQTYPKNNQSQFSRSAPANTPAPKSMAGLADQARQFITNHTDSSKTFNWWHNTIGTQAHKATVDSHFKKVFEASMAMEESTAKFANAAADMAQSLLPKLEGLKSVSNEILKAQGWKRNKDAKAIGQAIFQTTLDDKPLTEAELVAQGYSPKQRTMYHEFFAAINKSMDDLAKSEMIREAKALSLVPANESLSLKDTASFYADQVDDDPNIGKSFINKAEQIKKLQDQGYAPLMRFGQYTLDVNETLADGTEKRIFFGLFESQAEANEMGAAMQSEYPEATIAKGVMSQQDWQMFKGITPETMEVFAKLMNVDKDVAFQEYLKSAVNNRSALKRLIHRKKMPGFAADPQRVLASFITSNAKASAKNIHLGDMVKAITDIPKAKGDVLDEAVNLYNYVQNPSEKGAAIRGLLFTWYLGGSVASAMVNLTQTLTTTAPYLHQFGETQQVARIMAKAMKLATLKSGAISGDLGQALKLASEEGITDPQELHMLYGESMRTGIIQSQLLRPLTNAWGSFFSLAESYNRRVAFIAAYTLAKETNKPDAFAFAAKAVNDTQFIYNKSARPNWARSTVGSMVFTFKTFSINYLEFLKQLPPKERLIALGILIVLSGLSGLPGDDDADDIIDSIGQGLGYNTNTKSWKQSALSDMVGKTAANYMLHGVSAGLPVDLSQRLGAGNLIPGSALFKRSETNKTRDIAEFVGPVGGLLTKGMDAFDAAQTRQGLGNKLSAIGKAIVPKAISDAWQGLDMLQSGQYKDVRGKKIVNTDATDALFKAIGLQPSSVAEQRRAERYLTQDVQLTKSVESDIAGLWAQGLNEKDQDKVKEAGALLKDWNDKNPDTPIRISHSQIVRRVKQMRLSSRDRLLKTAPKEMRRYANQLLANEE